MGKIKLDKVEKEGMRIVGGGRYVIRLLAPGLRVRVDIILTWWMILADIMFPITSSDVESREISSSMERQEKRRWVTWEGRRG